MFQSVTSTLPLKTSSDSDSTTVGNCSNTSTLFLRIFFFLIFNLNLHWCNLKPLALILSLLPWLAVGIFFLAPFHLNRNEWIVLTGLPHGVRWPISQHLQGMSEATPSAPGPTVYAGVSFADASFLERTSCFRCWALDPAVMLPVQLESPNPFHTWAPADWLLHLSLNTTSTNSYSKMVSVLV